MKTEIEWIPISDQHKPVMKDDYLFIRVLGAYDSGAVDQVTYAESAFHFNKADGNLTHWAYMPKNPNQPNHHEDDY